MSADFCVPPQHEAGMPSPPPDRNLPKDGGWRFSGQDKPGAQSPHAVGTQKSAPVPRAWPDLRLARLHW